MPALNPTAVEATSNFYEASPGIRAFRLALTAAERLWPALAVRLSTRLFLTPLPPKWLLRRTGWRKEWRAERWPFEDAGVTVYTPLAANDAPVVLLAHGWGGHAGQMLPLAQVLASHGLRPVLIEMPGHGASSGSTSALPQFARAIEYVAARLQQQGFTLRALIAHSLGANAGAFAAARGLAVQKLVLVAPPASPREYTSLFARVFGLSETTRAAMQRRIEEREGIVMPHFEPDAVGPRVRMPTLVVHDHGDRINSFADGQAYAHAIRESRLVATDGLGHRNVLKDAKVLGEIAIFLG